MPLLIFGASGFIGRQLRTYFEGKGETVIGTYCTRKQSGLIHFDLRNADLRSLGKEFETAAFAIVCSFVTDLDRCRNEWDETYAICVRRTIALLKQLQAAGIIPVFFSTDYVYDGLKGRYSEEDPRKPVLAYGLHKKEVEDFLLDSNRPFILVRCGRIYGFHDNDGGLLASIRDELRGGNLLRMAVDQVFSPSCIYDVCHALDCLMQSRQFGCYNMGSNRSVSRFDFASLVKTRLGIETGRVIPCRLSDLKFGDKRPLNTSLNPVRLEQAIGFRFSTVEESLDRFLQSGGGGACRS